MKIQSVRCAEPPYLLEVLYCGALGPSLLAWCAQAWSSCNVHYAAIKYEIAGKVHSIYRRTHGPEKHGVDAWKKGAPDCGQCDGFDPTELITDCWVSKWKSGAPNAIGTDFQMFSNEQDYFDRSAGLTPWKFCNFDDCGNKVGYPRDCGLTGAQPYDWHAFEGGKSGGKTDVAFYISVCNGWSAPIVTLGDPGATGWVAVYTIVLLGLGYFVGGSALGARRKGEPFKKGPEMLRQHPHYVSLLTIIISHKRSTQLTSRRARVIFFSQGNWSQLHGLVQDGVGFSCARLNAKLGRARGDGYQQVPQSRQDIEDQANRSGKGSSKSKGKKSTRQVSKRSKGDKQPKQSARDKKTKGEGGSTDQQTIEAIEETTEEERERLLCEERTAGVHSSQQAIKVVGLNG
eukprot:COSAG02_NODE_3435_length_6748_cov_4.963303_2_plen_401_part_00